MKKRISFTLALLLILSVCILPFATHAEETDFVVVQANTCAAANHPITGSSAIVSETKTNFRSTGTAKHEFTLVIVRSCSCGEIIQSFTSPGGLEDHSYTYTVSPHANNQHTAKAYCSPCGYVQQNFTYPCFGPPCHEPW